MEIIAKVISGLSWFTELGQNNFNYRASVGKDKQRPFLNGCMTAEDGTVTYYSQWLRRSKPDDPCVVVFADQRKNVTLPDGFAAIVFRVASERPLFNGPCNPNPTLSNTASGTVSDLDAYADHLANEEAENAAAAIEDAEEVDIPF